MPRTLVFVASLLFASLAHAQFIVSSLADSGPGSMRQAIIDANALVGDNSITFTVAGTIELST